MEYKMFLDQIQSSFQQLLGEDALLAMFTVPKNNGRMLDGLCVRYPDSRPAPTIYLNDYYEQFVAGLTMDEILSDITAVLRYSPSLDLGAEQIEDFSFAKEKIMFKVINASSNTALLEDVPHCPILDLAIVFYLCLGRDSNGQVTALIHKAHRDRWGVADEELFELALVNTPQVFPSTFKSMVDVFKDMAKEQMGEYYNGEFIETVMHGEESEVPLYVLSNSTGLNGAGCILYPGLLEKISDSLNSDLIILPSSIHETLLTIAESDVSYDDFAAMVTSINQHEVPLEDRLSNQVYLYSRIDKKLTLAPRPDNLPTSLMFDGEI